MACTTILVGKDATYDGSTMIARNDDSPSGIFMVKKMAVVEPKDQPRHYRSVLSHVEIELPEKPYRYTCIPNVPMSEGIWAASGVNEKNVGMTATETITSNPLVEAADPLVELVEAHDGKPEIRGGIGEEDLVAIVLPYISSAREGVLRLGALLEQYGTYEENGIAFSDEKEVWWLETIGGHHWIAKRVPDDRYVIMPNQFGLDEFDLADAFGAKESHLCSADLREFVESHHLNPAKDGSFNPRVIFGSHSDSDHIYNTPRAWFMGRYFNPNTHTWDGPMAEFTPSSDDIPWSFVPERKIRIEDVKYVLSSHFQGTPFDPYGKNHPQGWKAPFRPIGISRTDDLALIQIRADAPAAAKAIQWVAFGSNMYNELIPIYAAVHKIPAYLAGTTMTVDPHSYYWAVRLVGALADPFYAQASVYVERFQGEMASLALHSVLEADKEIALGMNPEEANEKIARLFEAKMNALLDKVLYVASCGMRNGFAKSDK